MNEQESVGVFAGAVGLIIILGILAMYFGFAVDVIEWSWDVGQSVIDG